MKKLLIVLMMVAMASFLFVGCLGVTPEEADLTAYNTALAAVAEEDYTDESWTAYQLIVAENVVTDQDTQAEVDAATAAITAAQDDLVLLPPAVVVTGIAVKTAPTKVTYTKGDSLELAGLEVTLTKSDTTTEDVVFADFATAGITTDKADGAALVVADTQVVITHTASGQTANQAITVNAPVIGLTGIAVLPKTMDLVVGGSDTITSVTATYEIKGTDVPIALGDCTYASSPTGIVTVDDGVVTAVTPGIATITVSYGGKTDTVVVTVSAAPAAVITIKAIPGVTAPTVGGTPVTAITPTAQYTGVVAWTPVATTFAGEKVYAAKITLTAKEGYTLTGVTANFFTVEGATTVPNEADSGVVTAIFPATEAAVINIAAISGVTAPVTGATPVAAIDETDQYTGTVTWDPEVEVDGTFASAETYTTTIKLTAKAGYTLTGVAANLFTVAGATTDTNPINSGVVTAVFPATDTTITIKAIPGVTKPVTDATPVTAITATAQYTGVVTWSPNDTTFAEKTAYTATITLTPIAGFTLTGVAVNFFTVAGATGVVTNAAGSGVVTAIFDATVARLPVHNITANRYYETIGAAITDALAGDTIEVAAGTYDQEGNTLDINVEGLTLKSIDGYATTIITTTTSPAIQILASDVTVEGFAVKVGTKYANAIFIGAVNSAADVSSAIVTGNKIYNGMISCYPGGDKSEITDNIFVGGNIGINLEGYLGGLDDIIISGNDNGCIALLNSNKDSSYDNIQITDNTISGSGRGMLVAGTVTDLTITYNDITDNLGAGIDIGDSSNPCTWGAGNVINYNNITGNDSGITVSDFGFVTGVTVIDATNNWWGTIVEAEINVMVSTDVDFTPFSTSSN